MGWAVHCRENSPLSSEKIHTVGQERNGFFIPISLILAGSQDPGTPAVKAAVDLLKSLISVNLSELSWESLPDSGKATFIRNTHPAAT